MRRDVVLVAEMIEACVRATRLAERLTQEVTSSDERWAAIAALSWQFTVIGEADRQFSEELRTSHPDIPWSRAIGLRDVITHTYWRVDESVLTDTAVNGLPDLANEPRTALAGLTSEG